MSVNYFSHFYSLLRCLDSLSTHYEKKYYLLKIDWKSKRAILLETDGKADLWLTWKKNIGWRSWSLLVRLALLSIKWFFSFPPVFFAFLSKTLDTYLNPTPFQTAVWMSSKDQNFWFPKAWFQNWRQGNSEFMLREAKKGEKEIPAGTCLKKKGFLSKDQKTTLG